ncbi:MAG TPA: penicillin-binding transpeptidase domain-containing protein [Candidatus Polarisedimenticolia bacterium]|nr:penicillin-binding transpeptidase domain-containing protein [Candidatus Polarisedimenticolia bacterium]
MSPVLLQRGGRRGRDGGRARRGAWVRRALAAAAAGYLLAFAWTGRLVGQAEQAYWGGRLDEASALLRRASFWKVRSGRVNDALAVVELTRGDTGGAAAHLAAAAKGFFHPAAFGEERVLLALLRSGRLEAARRYAEHRTRIHATPSLAWYLGLAEAGLGRLDEADRHLAAAAAGPQLRQKAEAERQRLSRARSLGRLDVVVDRSGAPVAALDLRTRSAALLFPDLAPLLGEPLAEILRRDGGPRTARLALDLRLQRAAEEALGSRRGALVAVDVRTGGVLAAASQPRAAAPGGSRPEALAGRYEPGSIIKMITLEAALRHGLDVEGLFPLDCPGWILLDGVAFRDWMPHRTVRSVDEAVAVSCNIAFGRLGALLGRQRLDDALERYGFPREGAPAGPEAGALFVPGRLLPPDPARPAYALARRAVGLDSLDVTPMHAALLAAALARGGVMPPPHLVAERLNILGEPVPGGLAAKTPPAIRQDPEPGPLPAAARALLHRTMVGVVVSRSGTARRAAVQGVEAAMKTGTSGENPPGHDALVIGFAPASEPRVAWAVVARHAGKAEWEGARITREFLTRAAEALR